MVDPSASATEAPPQEFPATPPAVADEAVAAAERIAFLALASELARGRKVLVVDDGASALAGIAAHLDSTELSNLDGAADGAYDLVVADLLVADTDAEFGIGQLARVVGADSGIALLRLPNRPEFAPLLAAFESSFARTLTCARPTGSRPHSSTRRCSPTTIPPARSPRRCASWLPPGPARSSTTS
ncbi:MAG: hypothetical protein QM648_05985 [Solirubrobacterales bacterium]